MVYLLKISDRFDSTSRSRSRWEVRFSESRVNEITQEKGDTGFWNWYHRCHILLKYYFENKVEVWQLQATVVVSTQTTATTRLLSFALFHRWLSETNLIRWGFFVSCDATYILLHKGVPILPSVHCQQFVLQKSSQLFQIVLPIFFSIIFSKLFGLGRQVRALYFLLDLRRRSRGVTLVWLSGFPKAVASLSALDSVLSLPFFRVSFAQILASENLTLACPSPGNCPAVHSWEQPFGLTWFSFDCIKKSEYLEKTHTGGENMQRSHSKTPNGQQIQTQLVTAAVKDLVSFKATSNLIHLAMLKRDDMH